MTPLLLLLMFISMWTIGAIVSLSDFHLFTKKNFGADKSSFLYSLLLFIFGCGFLAIGTIGSIVTIFVILFKLICRLGGV